MVPKEMWYIGMHIVSVAHMQRQGCEDRTSNNGKWVTRRPGSDVRFRESGKVVSMRRVAEAGLRRGNAFSKRVARQNRAAGAQRRR